MHKPNSPGLLPALVLTIALSPAIRAAGVSPAEQTGAMRQDLDALRQGQEAMGKDIAEIKKILQALQPPPPVRPIDAVLQMDDSPSRGNPDAKLTLIEYSDYQCPFCKRHVDLTVPQLDKDYIATGKVRYVFRDFPLESIHPHAFKAAEAAHCAGQQGKYWEMHDKLFASQQALSPEDLGKYAGELGLNASTFRTCLDSGATAQKVRDSIAEGERLDISATPALLLGVSDGNQVKDVRIMLGALPFGFFKEEIDKLLATAPGSE